MSENIRVIGTALYFAMVMVYVGFRQHSMFGVLLAGIAYLAVGMSTPLWSEDDKRRFRRGLSMPAFGLRITTANSRRARLALVVSCALFLALAGLQHSAFAILQPSHTKELWRFVAAYAVVALCIDWWLLRSFDVVALDEHPADPHAQH